MCKSSLSKTRRPVEKDVVESLPPHLCRGHENLQVTDNLVLPGKFFESLWPYNSVNFLIFACADVTRIEFSFHRPAIFLQNY